MDRKEAKIFLPMIQAFAEGKNIQYQKNAGEWRDMDAPNWMDTPSNYRIKPEPKYRPFYMQEECWNEMMKHQPFEWIVNQIGNKAKILYIDTDFILIAEPCKIHSYDYDEALKYFKFVDGTPFGVKEETSKTK